MDPFERRVKLMTPSQKNIFNCLKQSEWEG